MGEFSHRQPPCDGPWIQSGRPFIDARPPKERSGTFGWEVAICSIPPRWYIRRLCDSFRIRLVVHLVQRRAADQFLSAGKISGISDVLNHTKSVQTHFHQCPSLFPEVGCEMFANEMAKTATTMSLSILVTVEMFNAMNSLSENESLLRFPVWKNPFLLASIVLSMSLHVGILYIPFLKAS